MKSRYKILIVIGGTIFIYLFITVILSLCMSFFEDCSILGDINLQTRLIVPGGLMWDTASDIGEWDGTMQGFRETKPGVFLQENPRFIFIFIIIPVVIITGLIIKDNR